MIIEAIAKAIEKSGKTRYQISKETGVDQALLCRLLQGGSCSMETADKLCKYLGLEYLSKGDKKMKTHKIRDGVPTATFEELSFKEQSQSITATISVLSRMIDSNIRRADTENRDSQDILRRRLEQIQRMVESKR